MATGYRNLTVYKRAFALAIENTETRVWLDFALACEYIPKFFFDDFNKRTEEIGRLLNHIIQNPEKYK
jgi:hypothetical protein